MHSILMKTTMLVENSTMSIPHMSRIISYILTLLVILGELTSFSIGVLVSPSNIITKNTPRIVGGDDAPINAYGWLAHVGNDKDSEWYEECSGALIAPQYVLISYECHLRISFYGSKEINIGKYCEDADNCCQPFEVLEIESIIPSPWKMYDDTNAHLSLVKLLSPSSITPVRLDVENLFPPNGNTLWMAGFGTYALPPDSTFGMQPSTLQHAEFNVMDSIDECLLAIQEDRDDDSYEMLLDTQSRIFCTNSSSSFPCYGDAGNPIYDEKGGVLVGIALGPVSNCARTKVPLVHIRVASFVSRSALSLYRKLYCR